MMLRLQLRPACLPLKLSFTISFVVSFSVSCCADPPRHRPTRLAPHLPLCRLSPRTSSPSSQARAPLRGCRPRRGLGAPCLPPVSPPSETTKPAASKMSYWRRRLPEVLLEGHDAGVAETNEMVMWSPAPVMEVARLAVDSGSVRSAERRARRGRTVWGERGVEASAVGVIAGRCGVSKRGFNGRRGSGTTARRGKKTSVVVAREARERSAGDWGRPCVA
jgi:hypothetical protein